MDNIARIKIIRSRRTVFLDEQHEEIILGCSVQPRRCETESIVLTDNLQESVPLRSIRDYRDSRE